MRGRIWAAMGLALALAACGRNADGVGRASRADYDAPAPPPVSEATIAPAMAQKALGGVVDEKPKIAPDEPSGKPPVPADDRQIAYTYTRTLRAPTTRMQDLMNAHKAACEKAGPSTCYVSNSSISGLGTENTAGTMELHATPAWMKTFLEGLPDSLKPFEASLDASNTSSEDLTVQIVDTSARLNSAKMLRERLNGLLKDRPGKLSDLLDIERELARVQGDIDSTESVIAALKARVGMSTLTLSYEPKLSPISRSIWRPLGAAFGNFLPNIVESLAGLVEFISAFVIWIVLVVGVIWLVVWRFSRRAKARAARLAGANSPPVPPAQGPKGPRPVGG